MANEVKWIKVVTKLFDDEKILLIKALPKADSLLVIWFELLCLAGKQNNGGVFKIRNKPYTAEMLASVLKRPKSLVKTAIDTFEEYGLIDKIKGTIVIANWDKHQSLDSYEKKKERDRKYQDERRKKQQKIVSMSDDVSDDKSSRVAVTEIDIDIEKKTPSYEGVKEKATPTQKYGEFKRVVLTDVEYLTLVEKLGDANAQDYIRRLDGWLAKGNVDKGNHFATMVVWYREDHKDDRQSTSFEGCELDELLGVTQ